MLTRKKKMDRWKMTWYIGLNNFRLIVRKTERKEGERKTSHPRIAHGQRYPIASWE